MSVIMNPDASLQIMSLTLRCCCKITCIIHMSMNIVLLTCGCLYWQNELGWIWIGLEYNYTIITMFGTYYSIDSKPIQ